MPNKSEIVVCRASYRKVFSASFRRKSFSTGTSPYTRSVRQGLLIEIASSRQLVKSNGTMGEGIEPEWPKLLLG